MSRHLGIEQGVLRPPSESRSLLLRVVRNCPWNRCRFCPAYKDETFSVRPVGDVFADIETMAADPLSREHRTLFLQDADALATPIDHLVAIVERARARLSHIERITAYARSNTLASRRPDELARLRAAGLNRVHVGVESGCDAVLARLDKGTTFARQRQGCEHARAAGFELCCYVMPGLGGADLSEAHAADTGRLIAEVAPDVVRLRTAMVLDGTPLADDYRAGRFAPLDEVGVVAEIRRFITIVRDTPLELISDHRINLLLELRGRLPADFRRLIGTIDRFLSLPADDQDLFVAGRRLQMIKILDEFARPDVRAAIAARRHEWRPRLPVDVNTLY